MLRLGNTQRMELFCSNLVQVVWNKIINNNNKAIIYNNSMINLQSLKLTQLVVIIMIIQSINFDFNNSF